MHNIHWKFSRITLGSGNQKQQIIYIAAFNKNRGGGGGVVLSNASFCLFFKKKEFFHSPNIFFFLATCFFFLLWVVRSRSCQSLFFTLIGRAPMYAPFISLSAFAQHDESRKLTNPNPFDFPFTLSKITFAFAKDLYFEKEFTRSSLPTSLAKSPTNILQSLSGHSSSDASYIWQGNILHFDGRKSNLREIIQSVSEP